MPATEARHQLDGVSRAIAVGHSGSSAAVAGPGRSNPRFASNNVWFCRGPPSTVAWWSAFRGLQSSKPAVNWINKARGDVLRPIQTSTPTSILGARLDRWSSGPQRWRSDQPGGVNAEPSERKYGRLSYGCTAVPPGGTAIRSFCPFTQFLDIPDTDRPEARRYEPANTTKNPVPPRPHPARGPGDGGFRC